MIKKFFEFVGMVTTGYVGYVAYKKYKKYKSSDVIVKAAEEEDIEDPSVEVDDFFAEEL